MTPELFAKFKNLVSHFKKQNKDVALFTIADMIDVLTRIPTKELELYVKAVMLEKSKDNDLSAKISTISPEAKARIEAILAEEAAKKG